MILNALKDDKNMQQQRNSMMLHRQNFDKYRKILETTKIGQQLQLHKKINLQQINQQKQKIIRDLDKIDGGADQQFQYFEELAFYQERYLQLIKYLKKSSDPRASTPTETQFQEIKNNFCKDARMSVGVYELDQENTMKKKKNKQNTDKQIKFSNLQFQQSQISGIKGLLQANNSKNQLQSFESIKGTGITKPIFQFFEKKQREKKTTKFRDIAPRPIQNKSPVSSMNRSKRTVIKKPAQSVEIQKLLQQNKRLYQMLQKKQKQENQLDSFEKNVLREERERCMRRIQQLEEEVQQLQRNNYRLKIAESQKSKNHPPNDTMNWNQSQNKIYQPYALNIRHNDLGKLSIKNNNHKFLDSQSQQFLDMDLGIPPIQKKQEKILKKSNFQNDFQNDSGDVVLQDFLLGQNQQNLPERPDRNAFKKSYDYGYSASIDRGSRFDSFSMANTAYNNSSLFLYASKNLVNIDSQTSTRNKVAFFKKSLIIVKDSDYEIAFKKSALDPTKTKQRLIFYIQNKTNSRQKVNINYDYQFNHYQINVTEPLGQLAPNSQGREVIEVGLARQCMDLNSVIDCHIKLGRVIYDLWVPVCFMEFSNYVDSPTKMRSNQHMIVQPDRQFRSYELASKLLPLSKQSMHSQDESQAYLTAKSKFGQFDIAINWWQKQMTIETHPKILDLLGFIFHHFK